MARNNGKLGATLGANETTARTGGAVVTGGVMKPTPITSHFDYTTVPGITKSEIKTLQGCETVLIGQMREQNALSIEMGRQVSEAKKIFEKLDNEKSFMAWYESIGFNKDNVRVAQIRYTLSTQFPRATQRIVELSDRAILKMGTKTLTNNEELAPIVYERVLISEPEVLSSVKVEAVIKEERDKYKEAEEAETVQNPVAPKVEKSKTKLEQLKEDLKEAKKDLSFENNKRHSLEKEMAEAVAKMEAIQKRIDECMKGITDFDNIIKDIETKIEEEKKASKTK